MAKAKFGSVKWQKIEWKRITKKIMKNQPLDARDRTFIDVQSMHNERIMKEFRKKRLKRVM